MQLIFFKKRNNSVLKVKHITTAYNMLCTKANQLLYYNMSYYNFINQEYSGQLTNFCQLYSSSTLYHNLKKIFRHYTRAILVQYFMCKFNLFSIRKQEYTSHGSSQCVSNNHNYSKQNNDYSLRVKASCKKHQQLQQILILLLYLLQYLNLHLIQLQFEHSFSYTSLLPTPFLTVSPPY